jgi:DNA-binding transcriptional MerR regulator
MSAAPLGPRDVARATGVSTDTLRHYERKGLLTGVTRLSSGYRRYPASTVERVLLIQRALVVGFSLADLKRVLSVRDRGGAPCRSVRTMLAERSNALSRRIEELLTLRDELAALLVEWDCKLAATPEGQRAGLLDGLATRPIIRAAARRRERSGLVVASRPVRPTAARQEHTAEGERRRTKEL